MVEISTIALTIIIAVATFLILIMTLDPLMKKIKCFCNEKPNPVCHCMKECEGCGDGDAPKLCLLSRGKPVTITPPWQSFPGSNLTDGDVSTFAHSADWISTSNVSAEIDLGQTYTIRKIKIFNRMDCCQDRFGCHKLYIDGTQVAEGDAKGAWEYEYCIKAQGQKVKIEMDGILNLGEVEVWGY